jgi:hypothetical protein
MKESVEEEKGCPRLVKFQDEEKKEEENEDELDSTELPPTVRRIVASQTCSDPRRCKS